MEKIKKLKQWIPELYLVGCIIFYWIATEHLLNPIGILLLALFAVLFLWQNRIIGIIISFLFLLLSLYMVLALLAELSEFPTFDEDAYIMLGVGGVWLGLNLLLGAMMMRKWCRHSPQIPYAGSADWFLTDHI